VTASRASAALGWSEYPPPPKDAAVLDFVLGGACTTVRNQRALDYGQMYEPRVRLLAERLLGVAITETGFAVRRSTPFLGASPDGLVPATELLVLDPALRAQLSAYRTEPSVLEIKCKHSAELPVAPELDHIVQLQCTMFSTGRRHGWLLYWRQDDFVLFHTPFAALFFRDSVLPRLRGFVEYARNVASKVGALDAEQCKRDPAVLTAALNAAHAIWDQQTNRSALQSVSKTERASIAVNFPSAEVWRSPKRFAMSGAVPEALWPKIPMNMDGVPMMRKPTDIDTEAQQ